MQSIHASYPHTLSTHPTNTPYQPILPTSPINTASSLGNGNGAATGTLAAEFSALGISLNNLSGHGGVTPTLSPLRPPDILTDEIFDLLRSQARFLEGGQHRALLDATAQSVVASSSSTGPPFSHSHTQSSVPTLSRAVGGIAAVYGNNNNNNNNNKQSSQQNYPQHHQQKPNNYANFSALLWGEADARARLKMQNRLLRKSCTGTGGGGGGTLLSTNNDNEKSDNGVGNSDRVPHDDRSAGLFCSVFTFFHLLQHHLTCALLSCKLHTTLSTHLYLTSPSPSHLSPFLPIDHHHHITQQLCYVLLLVLLLGQRRGKTEKTEGGVVVAVERGNYQKVPMADLRLARHHPQVPPPLLYLLCLPSSLLSCPVSPLSFPSLFLSLLCLLTPVPIPPACPLLLSPSLPFPISVPTLFLSLPLRSPPSVSLPSLPVSLI